MLDKTEIIAGIHAISRDKKYKWSPQHDINQKDISDHHEVIQEAIKMGYSKRSIYEYLSTKKLISMSQATFYRYCKTIFVPQKKLDLKKPDLIINLPEKTSITSKLDKDLELQKLNETAEQGKKTLETVLLPNHTRDLEALGLI